MYLKTIIWYISIKDLIGILLIKIKIMLLPGLRAGVILSYKTKYVTLHPKVELMLIQQN